MLDFVRVRDRERGGLVETETYTVNPFRDADIRRRVKDGETWDFAHHGDKILYAADYREDVVAFLVPGVTGYSHCEV